MGKKGLLMRRNQRSTKLERTEQNQKLEKSEKTSNLPKRAIWHHSAAIHQASWLLFSAWDDPPAAPRASGQHSDTDRRKCWGVENKTLFIQSGFSLRQEPKMLLTERQKSQQARGNSPLRAAESERLPIHSEKNNLAICLSRLVCQRLCPQEI